MGGLTAQSETVHLERDDTLALGDWFWVTDPDEVWFGCITALGSNYVQMTHPNGHERRIHLDTFGRVCRREQQPDVILAQEVDRCRGRVRALLQEVNRVTRNLGVTDHLKIGGQVLEDSTCRSLSVVSATASVEQYEQQLVDAKDTVLPGLFEDIKEANKELGYWLAAPSLPIQAQSVDLKTVLKGVDSRLQNVRIYSGLTEDAVQVRKGVAAPASERLHLFQRRLYMDEECLAAYQAGGIEFRDITGFDRWLCRRGNLERLLPFPRCAVAFRVRRYMKQRDTDGSFLQEFVRMRLDEYDKVTFLYFRNGQQVWRINAEIDFGSNLFPDVDDLNFDEPMRAQMRGQEFKGLITERQFRQKVAWERERRQKARTWRKEHPGKHEFDNPHRDHSWYEDRLKDYHKVTPESIYYDDIMAALNEQVQAYNKMALVLQGVFDRSPVLQPHGPARLWEPEGFDAAVKLVYDSSRILNFGEPPDFAAYQARCNESLAVGSTCVGQQDVWLRVCAERENARREKNWRDNGYRHKTYHPYGDPGPGKLARVTAVRGKGDQRQVCFRWQREAKRYKSRWSSVKGLVYESLWVAVKDLFHVDAYQPGDFRQFYQDPRTRRDYIKWAPWLLGSEDFKAGKTRKGKRE